MSTTSNEHDIDASLRKKLNDYFSDLGDSTPVDMYDMVLQVFEKPLLEEVMARADQNQSRAAHWLGLNRNTLRKKLAAHGLLKRG